MKTLKKIATLLTLILAINMSLPQTIPNLSTNSIVEAATIKISKKKATLTKGQSITLKITGTKGKVTWKSSNKKVASVSSKGKVTAKKKGTTTITAKIGKNSLTCKITVKDKDSSFSYSANGYTLKYLSYELGENSSGEDCIITYWDFTNNSGKSVTPYYSLTMRAYQNGIELTPYSSYDDKYPEVDLCYNKKVQNGTKVKIAYMHKINGKSSVSFEISPQLIYSDTKIGEITIAIK